MANYGRPASERSALWASFASVAHLVLTYRFLSIHWLGYCNWTHSSSHRTRCWSAYLSRYHTNGLAWGIDDRICRDVEATSWHRRYADDDEDQGFEQGNEGKSAGWELIRSHSVPRELGWGPWLLIIFHLIYIYILYQTNCSWCELWQIQKKSCCQLPWWFLRFVQLNTTVLLGIFYCSDIGSKPLDSSWFGHGKLKFSETCTLVQPFINDGNIKILIKVSK